MNGFDAESGVIGSILIDENALALVSPIVCASDFHLDTNRKIYEAALKLQSEDKPIDPLAIIGIVGEKYTAYMTELIQVTPTSANAELYAQETRKASMWRSLKALGEALDHADTTDDPRDTLGEIIRECERIEGMDTAKELVNSGEAMTDFYNHRAIVDIGGAGCVKTGYRQIDALLGGGFLNSGLYIIAARPGMGKTTFALSVTESVVKRGEPVLFVSLEMDNEQIMAKRISGMTGIGASELMMDRLTPEQYKKMQEAAMALSKRPLHLNRKTWATIDDVRNWARKVKGLKMVVVDYFGLLKHNGRSGSRYEAMTEISGQLKALARNLKVPIVCLAQLNRENMQRKGMRPQLSDLRDTGALEQDADGVIFLHRPDYYGDGDNPSPGVPSGPVDLQVILAKNRHGATGSVSMDFYLKTGKIVPSSYS